MSSIRLRLLKWLIGPILLINLAVAALTYLLAWTPAQLAFDQGLADAAGALAARLRGARGAVVLDLPPQAEQVLRADKADAIYFVVRSTGGMMIAGDDDFPLLAPAPQALAASMRGEAVRVATLVAEIDGVRLHIGVAKTLRKLHLVRSATIRTLLLLETLFTLALVGLIWFSVTNGLQPLARMRAKLNARDGADLTPVGEDGVTYELAPVVSAFNDLLGRVQAGARSQHDFLANVAHQLRTPLAGMKLQLEWLAQRHRADPDTVHSVGLMLQSNERMIRQVNQLLALARAEPARFEKTRLEGLDLAVLVGDAVQFFVDEAAKKGIDLGFNLLPTPIAGDPFLLRDLIDNLIDNALRYTPAEGTVTVSCFPDGQFGMLLVEDSGPGIAPARREQVFARFVRLDDKTTGSGLGLAIVRDIAAAHGARVAIDGRESGPGAIFSVRFPA
jgi:two-component system sensor histidine kinase TctE